MYNIPNSKRLAFVDLDRKGKNMQTFEIVLNGNGTLEIIRADRLQSAYKELRIILTMQGLSLTEQLAYTLDRI